VDWLWRRLAAHVPSSAGAPPPAAPEADSRTTPEGIFRDVAARQLDAQVSTNDVLDARNMNIVWVGSTVLPVTFGLLSIGQVEIPKWAGLALRASLAFYVLLLVSSWWASRYRGLGFRPDLFDLHEHSQTYSAAVLEQWVAIEYTRSSDENEDLLKKKARWVGAASTLLYLEGLALSLAAVMTLL
jgi:hypothetical protein